MNLVLADLLKESSYFELAIACYGKVEIKVMNHEYYKIFITKSRDYEIIKGFLSNT